MHFHAYVWTGPKQRFDEEALRRPPYPEPPPADGGPELIRRYKEVAAEFPVVDLPPLETARWLVKPGVLVRGTWDGPKEAAGWLGERLAAYGPRFASAPDRAPARAAALARSAAERLGQGGDVAHGFYLERPAFLSLALVCCSPNRALPELRCPLGQGPPTGPKPAR
ncbi:hypothetical protein ACGH2B_18320 [Streptomyces sp. BBFR2]|uniref:hypothetical protein n=1 Tax=Streptomyces sp. BBFR2 TaxID=3372854 RepID=UPI0037D9E760